VEVAAANDPEDPPDAQFREGPADELSDPHAGGLPLDHRQHAAR
jgi:hypothetical protein